MYTYKHHFHEMKLLDLMKLMVLSAVVTVLMTACESVSRDNSNVLFSVDSSHDRIYVGESVTVWTQSTNTVGREPEIEWSSSGGDIEELRNGSAVRVTFDTPGTYQVSAKLNLENGIDRMDEVSIRVVQLP